LALAVAQQILRRLSPGDGPPNVLAVHWASF
jgi:hypothetical protein